jgi:hypothetical protein
MARTRYIICAEDRLLDRFTGLASHINVVDKIVLAVGAANPPGGQTPLLPEIDVARFIMTAVWVREPGDDGPFDYDVLIHRDSGIESVARGEFEFTKMFHRIDAGFRFTTKTKSTSGLVDIECRIRKQGASEWLSQSFPLEIEVRPSDSILGASAASANENKN